jgi:glycosyltransferase involved in cell wall biosynthesis
VPNTPEKRLVFVVTEDWFFLSHFLFRAVAASKAGYEVVVATRDNGHRATIEAQGLRVVEIPFRRGSIHPLGELKTMLALRRLLRTCRPDIVHLVALKPIIYGALVGGDVAVVNAPVGLGFVYSTNSPRALLLRPLVSLALRYSLGRPNSRAVFENSDDLRQFTSTGVVPPQDAILIPGAGVDLNMFPVAPEPEGRLRVVLVSRMLKVKGINEFVAAARLLRRQRGDIDFVLVGAADPQNPSSLTTAQLEAWQAEGVVQWLGQRADVHAILAAGHLVVLPSYREGLPKILIEAMAAQRAIVTTDVPGCREAVTDGVNGLLVPPRDAAALARAIARLADDPELRRRLARAGRERAERLFSSQAIVAQTLATYRAVLGGAPNSPERQPQK